jgi:hypothetical protein
MKRLICALVFLGLASCGEGGDAGAPQKVTSIKAQSAYVEKLRALSPQHRDLALRRAIQDSGQSCKRITSSQETGTYKNMASWTAHCEGGRDWAIFIAPNGDAQVRSCKHVEQLGLPACRKASG